VNLDAVVTLDMLDKQGGLRIDGGLSARQSQFKFYLGGTTAGDVSVLPVGGAASFNGFDNFTFYLVDGWRPGLGEQLTWLAAGGGVSFAATDAWQIYTLDADGHASFWGDAGGIVDPTAPAGMQVGFADGHLVFALAAVPEPAPLALMLAGVLGLALVRARRKDWPMR